MWGLPYWIGMIPRSCKTKNFYCKESLIKLIKAIAIFITKKDPVRQSNCSSLSQGLFAICISLCHELLGISTNKETASSESRLTVKTWLSDQVDWWMYSKRCLFHLEQRKWFKLLCFLLSTPKLCLMETYFPSRNGEEILIEYGIICKSRQDH